MKTRALLLVVAPLPRGATLTEISTMLQLKIIPQVLASLEHVATMYDFFPIESEFNRMGTTNTVRTTRNINTYTVNPLPDGTTITPQVKSTDFIDITAVREYVAEDISHGVTVQALAEWFPTTLSNMLESIYVNTVRSSYTTIAGTAGIGIVGIDNVAITRAVIQLTKQNFANASIPAANRSLALSPLSEGDVASIPDYNRAFSRTGEIPAEVVPRVAGMTVWETPADTLNDGTAGEENLAVWLPAVKRVHLDETPNIERDRSTISRMPMPYRGLKTMLWLEEQPGTLGGITMSISHTHGSGVVRETGVQLVRGR